MRISRNIFERSGVPRAQVGQQDRHPEISQCPSLVNRCRVLNKDNKARVVHYKSVDPMKDEKFSDRTMRSHVQFHLVYLVTATTTKRLQQANLLMMIAEKERKKCNQCGHIVCKCKVEIMIHFSCKKQGRIQRDHPNLKREPNSKDQSLRANLVKKFLRKDCIIVGVSPLLVEKKMRNKTFRPYLDRFVVVLIDDIL
ncbi:hypothetical protein CR513_00579, partial [Mucuna pruriens]